MYAAKKKTYLVCTDGSSQAASCVELVASMVAPTDSVIVMHITPADGGDHEKTQAEMLVMEAKLALERADVQARQIETRVAQRKADYSIADMILHAAHVLSRGTGILVIGTAGKGASERGQPKGGIVPMGAVAESCLTRCKQPVILVKVGGGTAPLVVHGAVHDQLCSLPVLVCVDSSRVSQVRPSPRSCAARLVILLVMPG